MLGEIIRRTREKRPLVHCITNYVTANDCANLLLACGASAIMADDPEESAEVTSMCSGLVLNLGTPSPRRLEGMLEAGRRAMELGHPIVFDPVGAGSSAMRRTAVQRMLEQLHFSGIRGNASEIATLVHGTAAHRGVDADRGNTETDVIENARLLAQRSGAVVAVTGTSDIVTDGSTVYRVHSGHPMMRCVTGAGCQLSALTGAYLAANPGQPLQAVLAAVCAMGLAGESAHGRLSPPDGNASYRNYIIDAIFHLTPEALEKGAHYEILS